MWPCCSETRKSAIPLALLLAGALSFAGCGGGGDGGGGNGSGGQTAASNLPAPPSGKATVGGTVTLDGKPASHESVGLSVGGAKARVHVRTDPSGDFVFRAVQPGKYSVAVAIVARGRRLSEQPGIPLAWDKPCRAAGYRVLNVGVASKKTGAPIGVIATASSSNFDVKAGDRLTKNIPFACTPPA